MQNNKKGKHPNLQKYEDIFYNGRIVKDDEFYMSVELKPSVHIHDLDMIGYLENRALRMNTGENEYLSIKDIIDKKDYDYIHMRYLIDSTNEKEFEDEEVNCLMDKPGEKETLFASACYSKSGKLIYQGYTRLSENEEVLDSFEWSRGNIKNGITIILNPCVFPMFNNFLVDKSGSLYL